MLAFTIIYLWMFDSSFNKTRTETEDRYTEWKKF